MVSESLSGVGVLDKAVAVLGAVEGGSRTLGDLVAATGLSRATAHRLAAALVAHGLLRRAEDNRYLPGLRLISLGRAATAELPLSGAAQPVLERLRDATGESVQLYVRDGATRVCVAALESPHGLRTIVPLGAVLPLGVGSAGKLLGGDAEALARGWAESVGEREPGVASVSAPVCDGRGVVAAVSVSGPIGRTSSSPGRRYAAAVTTAAREIEAAAGLHPA